jgi:hypothetical protein
LKLELYKLHSESNYLVSESLECQAGPCRDQVGDYSGRGRNPTTHQTDRRAQGQGAHLHGKGAGRRGGQAHRAGELQREAEREGHRGVRASPRAGSRDRPQRTDSGAHGQDGHRLGHRGRHRHGAQDRGALLLECDLDAGPCRGSDRLQGEASSQIFGRIVFSNYITSNLL